MTRLPKKQGITQVEEEKSLILRQNVCDASKDINDVNLCTDLDDSCIIPDEPINSGFLRKVTESISSKFVS
jgi:hypothetical protein